MGHLPIIADVSRVAFHYKAPGVAAPYAINVMHFRQDAVDQDGLAGAIIANWQSDQLSSLSTSAELDSFEITPLDGTSATRSYLTDGADHWSGNAGSEWVPQVAVIVKLESALRGRSFRGRLFLPFTGESKIDGGTLDPTFVTAMTTGWNDFNAAMLVDSVVPVIASYKHASAEAIVGMIVEGQTATQRRRMSRLR
jgi:hypothetical protein